MCNNNSGGGLLGLGITLVVLGSLSTILGIASAAAFSWDGSSRISAPIWAGLFVVLTGSMGIMAGRNFSRDGRSSGFIPAFLTLSIIGIFVTIAQQSVNGTGGTLTTLCHVFIDNYDISSACSSAAAMHYVCVTIGFIEMCVCFASSIVGCVVGCGCCAPQPQPGVVVMQTPPAAMTVTSINTTGAPGAYAYPQTGYIQQPGGYVQQPGGFVQQPGGLVQQPVGAPPSYLPPPAQQVPPAQYPAEQKAQPI